MTSWPEVIGAVSKPVEKLIEAIRAGIGTYYAPAHIIRMANAKAQAKKIKAIAARDLEKIKIGDGALIPDIDLKQLPPIELFESTSLEYRTATRLKQEFLWEQNNIENIVDKAFGYLPESVSDQAVDPDWSRRFFRNCKNVSKDELQDLWAKILANEVCKTNSYSYRTLETLSQLEKGDLELYSRLGRICALRGFFILPLSKPIVDLPLTHLEEMHLVDCGLLAHSDSIVKFTERFSKEVYEEELISGKKLVITAKDGQSLVNQTLKTRILSLVGRELLTILPDTPDLAYLESLDKKGYNKLCFKVICIE